MLERKQTLPSPHNLSREDLAQYFDMPIKAAAKEIGICTTILKKLCRKNGIPRWPHRKIQSLNKAITALQAVAGKDPKEDKRIRQEIALLVRQKDYIKANPSTISSSTKKRKRGSDEGAESSDDSISPPGSPASSDRTSWSLQSPEKQPLDNAEKGPLQIPEVVYATRIHHEQTDTLPPPRIEYTATPAFKRIKIDHVVPSPPDYAFAPGHKMGEPQVVSFVEATIPHYSAFSSSPSASAPLNSPRSSPPPLPYPSRYPQSPPLPTPSFSPTGLPTVLPTILPAPMESSTAFGTPQKKIPLPDWFWAERKAYINAVPTS